MKSRAHRLLATGLALSVLPALSMAQLVSAACGSLDTHYGPFDYRTDRGKLPIVEQHHFTASIESLIRGKTGTLGGDLDYTLRAFPNHHRALVATIRLAESKKTAEATPLTVDCYFERALQFRRNDVVVRMMYADYLGRSQRQAQALQHLEFARTLADDNPLTHYNIGLLFFQFGHYAEALSEAHIAMALGMSRPDLMQKLQAAGQWVDPPPASAEAPAAASAAGGS